MPEDFVQSQYRLKNPLHSRLKNACELLHESQNEFLSECVAAICDMIEAETEADIVLPEVVAKARAVIAARKSPRALVGRISEALDDLDAAKKKQAARRKAA